MTALGPLFEHILGAFWTHFGGKMRPKCTQNRAQMDPNGAKKVSSGVRFGHFFEDSWGPKSCKYAIQVTKNEGPHFGCKFWFDFCAMFFEFHHCFFMFLNAQIL